MFYQDFFFYQKLMTKVTANKEFFRKKQQFLRNSRTMFELQHQWTCWENRGWIVAKKNLSQTLLVHTLILPFPFFPLISQCQYFTAPLSERIPFLQCRSNSAVTDAPVRLDLANTWALWPSKTRVHNVNRLRLLPYQTTTCSLRPELG